MGPYVRANLRDNYVLLAGGVGGFVIGLSAGTIEFLKLGTDPSVVQLIRTMLLAAIAVGGCYSLFIGLLAARINRGEVSDLGVRLSTRTGTLVNIPWSRRGLVLHLRDNSKIPIFAKVTDQEPRALLWFGLTYLSGVSFYSTPIPRPMFKEILESARRAGLEVAEQLGTGGRIANQVVYTIRNT